MERKKDLRLGIIGHGFVGKATDNGFSKNVKKFIVDPIYSTNIDDLVEFSPELVFICVPTPMSNDGKQDTSIIRSVVDELSLKVPDSIVVIKSTVLPNVLSELTNINEDLIYNPEFLREKFANEDFINSPMILLGGDEKIARKVADYYKYNSNCICEEYIFVEIISASIIKYSINTFLATKVIFFNEIYNIFNQLCDDDSWDKIISTIALDTRIGNSHMDVPGHDGRFGFGGACFPKDSSALIHFSDSMQEDLSVLKAAVKKNNSIRKQYSELDDREKEQNVNFDDNH